LMTKSVEQVVAVVGAWRVGLVHVPLFTAFATPAIDLRLAATQARFVVVDQAQRSKLVARSAVGSPPRTTIVVGSAVEPDDVTFTEFLAAHGPCRPSFAGGGAAPLLQLFTSGTTGSPKGVVMPVAGLASVHTYMEFGLDVRSDDVFWNAADPGWAYGLYYGLLGPLCLGVPNLWLSSGFDAALTWRVLAEYSVSNFAAAPTVYRALRQHVPDSATAVRLRRASAAGEPLTPEINDWAPKALGVFVHDHYGQTETGMVVNTHHHAAVATAPQPGVMGRPMPGWSTAVLAADSTETVPAGVSGRLAVDLAASPLMWFAGYENAPDKTAEKVVGDGRWYLTGDTAWVDEAGLHHFVSRDDDVIIMAGYRIGPFDVESVLLRHPLVVEAAVVAAPDVVRGEVLEAFVVLAPGEDDRAGLVHDLQQLVKTEYAAHAYPRRIHVVDQLPKTPSGKIQRFVLRAQRRAELEQAGNPT
jgi:acetyl-CoA synthetase